MAKRKTSKRARARGAKGAGRTAGQDRGGLPEPTARQLLFRDLDAWRLFIEQIAADAASPEPQREHARSCLGLLDPFRSDAGGLSDDEAQRMRRALALGKGIAQVESAHVFGFAGASMGRQMRQMEGGHKRLGGPEALEQRRTLARRLAETLRAESPGRLRSNRAAAAAIAEHPEWKALNHPTSPGQIARYLGRARDT